MRPDGGRLHGCRPGRWRLRLQALRILHPLRFGPGLPALLRRPSRLPARIRMSTHGPGQRRVCARTSSLPGRRPMRGSGPALPAPGSGGPVLVLPPPGSGRVRRMFRGLTVHHARSRLPFAMPHRRRLFGSPTLCRSPRAHGAALLPRLADGLPVSSARRIGTGSERSDASHREPEASLASEHRGPSPPQTGDRSRFNAPTQVGTSPANPGCDGHCNKRPVPGPAVSVERVPEMVSGTLC